ncbi:MAG: DUF624 domain-containing protein [Anaerolineae bacterium]|nr:DUF624 domain-containing protein [Anaerolineae bacterium]MDW8100371.1 DUF624 domain-containing protein [Anaerolineae bacterium]
MRVLRVIGLSIRDFYEEMFLFVPLNLVWWLAAVLVIPLAPATAGLCHLGYRIAHELRVDSSFFKEAFRDYFWPSLKVGALDVAILVTFMVNLWFYAQINSWLRLISILWIYGLILWAAAQLYLFPLLFEQKEPKALMTIRNAALLVLAQPLFTLGVSVLALILTIICLVLPVLLVLVWPGLMALIGTRALANVLEQARALAARSDQEKGGKGE